MEHYKAQHVPMLQKQRKAILWQDASSFFVGSVQNVTSTYILNAAFIIKVC